MPFASASGSEMTAYQTFVVPSFSGRPRTPTLMTWRSLGKRRRHLMPVCVVRITSV